MAVDSKALTGRGNSSETADLDRKSRPVLVWATVGAAFLTFNIYLFARWWWTGDAKTVGTGSDRVPTRMKVAVHTWEALISVGCVLLFYRYVIKPWRRDRRLEFDSLLVLSFCTIMWQDVFMNFTQTSFLYTAEFINFGSWYKGVPGWVSPHGSNVPEPVVGIFTLYGPFFFLGAVFGCWCMRKAKELRPTLRSTSLFAVGTFAFMVFLAIFEVTMMWSGAMWAYPGAVRHGPLRWLTLFGGHYYQYPLYSEALFGGALMATFAALRYFKNDKGQSWAERGIDEVSVGPRQKTGIRLLAIIGILNAIYLCVYFIPWNVFSLNSDAWPKDIVDRSYLIGGNACGPGTTYACPSPDTPIPRPGSARIGPDGQAVPPDGPQHGR